MDDNTNNRNAPRGAGAPDAADAAGDAAGAPPDAPDAADATAFYVERLADIGADSPLFAAFYDADAGVWAWRMAWIATSGRMCVVEEEIPDELLRDGEDGEEAPDLRAAIVAGRAAVQGFCAAYADEDPVLAAILDALLAGENGDDAAVAAATARMAALYAACDAA